MPTLKKRAFASALHSSNGGGEAIVCWLRRPQFAGVPTAHCEEIQSKDNLSSAVVWAGRGELTAWPAVDWAVLQQPGYEPIWDRQPLTSSYLWSRRMGRSYYTPHDGAASFGAKTKPFLSSVDVQDRMSRQWAQISSLLKLKKVPLGCEPPADTPAPVIRLLPQPAKRATAEELLDEIHAVETFVPRPAQPRRDAEAGELRVCSTTNKVKHTSKLWALYHRNRLAASPDEAHPERLEAYKCRWCGGWHVGHAA